MTSIREICGVQYGGEGYLIRGERLICERTPDHTDSHMSYTFDAPAVMSWASHGEVAVRFPITADEAVRIDNERNRLLALMALPESEARVLDGNR